MKNFVLFLAFTSLFVSCAIEGEDVADRLDFDRETFNTARRLWLDQDFQNYSFHLAGYPSGFRSGTVIVKDGVLDRFIMDDEVDAYDNLLEERVSPFQLEWTDTISGLYEKINNARAPSPSGGFEWRSRIEMEYDDTYHFFKSCFRVSWPVPVDGGEIPVGYNGYSIVITDFTPEGAVRRLSFDRETFNAERRLWLERDFQNYSFHLDFHDYGG
ncbi:MAG: hypothetical protein LBD58_12965 [Treponema sp.]|jgi:hypothetical protein|nr:hypothetical protein [Treponema sp.]